MPTLIKPGVLAKALNVTTNALRKRRMRDSDPYDYLIDSVQEELIIFWKNCLRVSVQTWKRSRKEGQTDRMSRR